MGSQERRTPLAWEREGLDGEVWGCGGVRPPAASLTFISVSLFKFKPCWQWGRLPLVPQMTAAEQLV